MVPEWNPDNCIQCNQCAYVCPHATIRPFALTDEEVANAPESLKSKKMTGKGCENYKFAMTVSPLDCMGCGVCVNVCPAPTKALAMVPQESQAAQQDVFNYCVENIRKKDGMMAETTVKGSQFNQPLLEFSGSCAGCAETAYGSSIWGGPAATSPYTTNKESGFGPAWANSLFEDNAEHGLGMYLGQKAIRESLAAKLHELAEATTNADKKAAIDEYFATYEDGKANAEATKKLVALLEAEPDCQYSQAILPKKNYLSKKSVWIFGGDGWAYDIGFGGLDHVLASGEDVNVMVFDTEVYSNTGGQASKASQIGQVAQFAAAGKVIGKKSLSEIAMSYGYVYVAQIAMGADMNQTIKALTEAESYHGPSLVIGYAPCEMHGVKGGMTNCQAEMKKAVAAGYWNMFRFDPRKKAEGKNPFTLDSKPATADYKEFISNETRYSRLKLAFPERAEELFDLADKKAKERYAYLQKLVKLYSTEE